MNFKDMLKDNWMAMTPILAVLLMIGEETALRLGAAIVVLAVSVLLDVVSTEAVKAKLASKANEANTALKLGVENVSDRFANTLKAIADKLDKMGE